MKSTCTLAIIQSPNPKFIPFNPDLFLPVGVVLDDESSFWSSNCSLFHQAHVGNQAARKENLIEKIIH